MCRTHEKAERLSQQFYSPGSIGLRLLSSRSKFSLHSLWPHSPFSREFRVITFPWKLTDILSTMSSLLFLPLLKFKSNLFRKTFNVNFLRGNRWNGIIDDYRVAASVVLPTTTMICPGSTGVIFPM